jgi:hypothetical protein
MQLASELANSQMIQAIEGFRISPTVREALELHESEIKRSVSEIQGLTAMQLHQDIPDFPVKHFMQGIQDASAIKIARDIQNSPVLDALRELESSTLIPALTRLTRTPFDPELIDQAVAIAHRAENEYQTTDEVSHSELATIESELNSFANETLNFTSLSEHARTVVLWLFYRLVLPFLMGIAAGITLDRYYEKSNVTEKITTSREAKKLARCDSGLDRQIFAGCRVVTGSGLRLRTEPGMKSEVITTLPLGKLITVLDSSERAWLHVEVDLNGELIEGWVARRYTTPFR